MKAPGLGTARSGEKNIMHIRLLTELLHNHLLVLYLHRQNIHLGIDTIFKTLKLHLKGSYVNA